MKIEVQCCRKMYSIRQPRAGTTEDVTKVDEVIASEDIPQ